MRLLPDFFPLKPRSSGVFYFLQVKKMTIKKGQKRKMPVSPGRPKGIDLYMKQQQARLDAEVAAMKAGIEQQKNSTEVVRNANFVALMGQPDNPNRISWSGLNNADFWRFGEQGCDFQDFFEGGKVHTYSR